MSGGTFSFREKAQRTLGSKVPRQVPAFFKGRRTQAPSPTVREALRMDGRCKTYGPIPTDDRNGMVWYTDVMRNRGKEV